jgi:hypothetical protein
MSNPVHWNPATRPRIDQSCPRPSEPHAFTDPDRAERREQHADGEFKEIFGNGRQWPVDHEAEEDDERQGGKRASARRNQKTDTAGSDGDDDEDHFKAFQHRDFEGRRDGHGIPSTSAVAEPTQRFRLLRKGGYFVM